MLHGEQFVILQDGDYNQGNSPNLRNQRRMYRTIEGVHLYGKDVRSTTCCLFEPLINEIYRSGHG